MGAFENIAGLLGGNRGNAGTMSSLEEADLPPSALDKLVSHLAKSAVDTAAIPGKVLASKEPLTSAEMVGPAFDMAGMLMTGAIPAGAALSRAGEVSLGIVPVDAARAFGIKKALPQTETFERAVASSPGARIDDGALVMNVMRRQKPEQELEQSVRGGVFYLPEGSPAARFYNTGTKAGGQNNYGGSQLIEGETALMNPLFVKGATGGQAPMAAMDAIMGKGAYEQARKDALGITNSRHWMRKTDDGAHDELVQRFLEKYAPEMSDLGWYIQQSSTKGNQLPYALQEAAAGSAVRRAGHDGVVGYSVGRDPAKTPRISELFDVRERVYPGTAGEFETWPVGLFGSMAPRK